MGWSFNCIDYGRKSFIEDITSQKHFSEGWTPLANRVVGNHVWQAVRTPKGDVMITLDLIAKERGGGWGYKGLSEDWGPYHYDCPLSLIAMCTPPLNENAAAWRVKVQEFHARKKEHSKKLVPGLKVKYGGHIYTLVEQWAPRKGWKVLSEGGAEYRMKAHQLSRAELA